MTRKLSYERYNWFHNKVSQQAFPNASHLAQTFEVSHKTAQRDIEFMMDRLSAPLEYNPSKKGYYYSDASFEMSPTWMKAEELMAFILAERISTAIPDTLFKQVLKELFGKLSVQADEMIRKNEEKISLLNIKYYRVNEHIFKQCIEALFQEYTLEITYYSPYSEKTSKRKIHPLHLLNYMGNWHLIAFCNAQKSLRTFTLSRIKTCTRSAEEFTRDYSAKDIKTFIRENFGLFTGETRYNVVIRFTGESARIVTEQIWHHNQKIAKQKDASILLEIPVTDFTEIKKEILSFGAQVQVLAPEILRKEIASEIQKMNRLYS